MATGQATISFLDKQSKTGSVSFHTVVFSAGNIVATNGLIDDAVAAIEAITLLNKTSDKRLASDTGFAPGLPTDPNAVKGVKWLVRGRDTNGNAVTMQIPGADLSLSANSKDLDVTAGEGLALKTALDAVWKSNDGEAVTVQEVVYLDK